MSETLITPDREPKIIKINFIGRALEIQEIPELCTLTQLEEAHQRIDSQSQGVLLSGLPNDHPWSLPKLHHGLMAAAETDPNEGAALSSLKDVLPENYHYLIVFMATFHDLGKIILAKKKMGLLPSNYRVIRNHGEESVNLLEEWGAISLFSPAAQEIIKYAIAVHGEKSIDLPKDNASNLDNHKYFFASLLRDADKLSLFRYRTDAYLAGEGKAKEMKIINDHVGPCREESKIEPPRAIEIFKQFQPIAFADCSSYESHMLRFLATIFDINFRSALEEIVKMGVVQKVLKYFYNQNIPADQYQEIVNTVNIYLSKFDLKLGSIEE